MIDRLIFKFSSYYYQLILIELYYNICGLTLNIYYYYYIYTRFFILPSYKNIKILLVSDCKQFIDTLLYHNKYCIFK